MLHADQAILRFALRLASCALLGSSVGGCLIHSVDSEPKAPVELPERFGQGGRASTDPGRWWTGFGDADLDRLVEQALAHNLELKQAWARLEQARALDAMATAGLWPRVGAELGAGRTQTAPRRFKFGGQETTIDGVTSDSFSASIPVSYELDVWGRIRSAMFAAEQDVQASRADVETAAVTIAANVTEQWFDVVQSRARRRLLGEQQRTGQRYLELVLLRYSHGDAALSEIYQQRQELESIRAQLELVDAEERIADQKLAVLLGQPPRSVVRTARYALPEPPPLPATGVPSDLLEQRPDLRAAKHRVVAADYRVGEALAARLPSFALSGSLGLSSPDLGSFFESFVWSVMGSISASLWDGGALGAEEDRTRAVLEERLQAYGQTLLNALLEVESSLVLERQQRRHIAALAAQAHTARQSLAAARRRYGQGLGNYLPVLTSLRSVQQAEQSLLGAHRQLLSYRVQLYRALGGTWTTELSPPEPAEEQDEQNEEAT